MFLLSSLVGKFRVPIAVVVALAVGGAGIAGIQGASAAAFTPVRLVVGPAYTDSYGHKWQPEMGATGGRLYRTSAPISGTTNDSLYRGERFDVRAYDIPLNATGTFHVKMRLAEVWWDSAGKRIFDVKSEGVTVASNLDIFARAGGKNRAYQLEFETRVVDNRLDLDFVNKVDFAKVASIEVTQVSLSTPPTTASPTPKPKPTTSTTVKPRNPGSVKPGASNTGVVDSSLLKRHEGDLTIRQSGVYSNLDVRGWVKIEAPNVTIRNSIFRGRAATQNAAGLVTNYGHFPNLVIEDSSFIPQAPSYHLEGFKGSDVTMRRVEIADVVDGIGIHGNNVTIESSWIHNLRHYSPFPFQPDNQTHNDGIQVHLGKNIRIVGNTIEDGYNAALMVTPNTGSVSNIQFNRNWANEGGCTVNVSEKKRGAIQGLVVNDNRFGRNTHVADCAIILPPATRVVAKVSGNVWDDNGAPVTIRKGI